MSEELFDGFKRRVFPSGSEAHLSGTLLGRLASEPFEIVFYYIRDDWRKTDGSCADLSAGIDSFWQKIPCQHQENSLRLSLKFHGEHEHTLLLQASKGEEKIRKTFAFYSLAEDLAGLPAWKGNIHNHTTRSDGKQSELLLPAVMRMSGFDFCAQTDHNHYARLEDRDASGLVCYPGEEASSSQPMVNHILSLGAETSITQWQEDNNGEYQKLTRRLYEERHFAQLPEHERKLAAQTEAVFQKVRQSGGVAVFCHPYWFCESRFYSTPTENDFLLRHGSFDALELGNYKIPRMAILNAKLMQLYRENAYSKPCVGSSDWHAREGQRADVAYTIIFAKNAGFKEFAGAIRKGRCVAVGGYNDSFPFGEYRLVKYACFLMEQYFQNIQDPLCREQGELMWQSQSEAANNGGKIQKLKNTIDKARKDFFGL